MKRIIRLSDPIKKIDVAKMIYYANYNLFKNYNETEVAEYLIKDISDLKFMKNFNKRMSIKLRLFAPNMYQIIYDYEHIEN